jgi:anti-sigma regulatory factor (Ser/Thr protein kinase)
MGCDGIWEKQSNEEAVKWVYEQIDKQKKERGITNNMDIDLKQITEELLLNNIATDVQSSGKYIISFI